MPTGLKNGAQELIPPQTRVAQAWVRVWHGATRDTKRRTARARFYANAMRHIR